MWWADWQMIVAWLCVAAAAIAIAKRVHDWLSGSAEGGCHSCPSRQSETVVPITALKLSPSLRARQAQPDRTDVTAIATRHTQ